jgi:hypothetical protein
MEAHKLSQVPVPYSVLSTQTAILKSMQQQTLLQIMGSGEGIAHVLDILEQETHKYEKSIGVRETLPTGKAPSLLTTTDKKGGEGNAVDFETRMKVTQLEQRVEQVKLEAEMQAKKSQYVEVLIGLTALSALCLGIIRRR